METRILRNTEIRAQGGNTISGYAAVFNSESEDLGGFIETIRPGAFARAIRTKQDVRCLFNHDESRVLGRIQSGTLRLAEDRTGLRFECRMPDSPTGRDVLEAIRRGDINQCSFGFLNAVDSWSHDGSRRELVDLDLRDVSPVTFPAYQATSVEARGRCGNYRFSRQPASGLYVQTADNLALEDDKRRLQARLIQEQVRS
jgi:hypothetical protein